MADIIKVTEGNSFILAKPLIAINAAGEQSPIQVDELTELVCRVYSPCGSEYGVSVSSEENRIFLQVPATMPRGVYNVDITAKRDEQRISLRLKDCFEIVAWDKQSNWQDYIIDGVVELPTQPTIIGALNIDIPADLEVNTLKATDTVTANSVNTTGHITAGGDVIATRVKTQRIVNPDNGKTEMVWKSDAVEVNNVNGERIFKYSNSKAALHNTDGEVFTDITPEGIRFPLLRTAEDQIVRMMAREFVAGDIFNKNGWLRIFHEGYHCCLLLGNEDSDISGHIGSFDNALKFDSFMRAFLQADGGVFIGDVENSHNALAPSSSDYNPLYDGVSAVATFKDGHVKLRGDTIQLYRRGDETPEVFRLAINSTGGLNFAKYDISDGHLEEELNFSWNDLVALKALIS